MRTLSTPGARAAVAATTTALAAALLLAACGGNKTVVISGSEGAAVSINPSGEVSISSSDGSVVVGGKQLPGGWPSEVGQPEGFGVITAATTTSGGKPAYTASFAADGDQLAAVNTWLDNLVASGFTKKAGIGGNTTSGGVTNLTSAQWDVTTIAMSNAGKTTLVINVKAAGS